MVSHSMIWPVPGGTLAFSIRLLVSGVRSFGMLGPGLAGDVQPARETAKPRPWTRCASDGGNLHPYPWNRRRPLYPPCTHRNLWPPTSHLWQDMATNQGFSADTGGPLWEGLVRSSPFTRERS